MSNTSPPTSESPWLASHHHSALVPITLSSHTYSIHVTISGPPLQHPNQPLVLLEAGLGASESYWLVVARSISKFARVLTYSRSGFGKSDIPPEDAVLHIDYRIREIKEVLHTTGLTGPYVLVGHSFGGPLICEFLRNSEPGQVAGMVFEDSFIAADDPLPRKAWGPVEEAAGEGWYEKIVGLNDHNAFTKEEYELINSEEKRDFERGTPQRELQEVKNSYFAFNEACKLVRTDLPHGTREYKFAEPLLHPSGNGKGRISVIVADANDWARLLHDADARDLGTEEQRDVMREWISNLEKVGYANKTAALTLTTGVTRVTKLEGWGNTHNAHVIVPEIVVKEVRWVLGLDE